jgi:hypothetical protein
MSPPPHVRLVNRLGAVPTPATHAPRLIGKQPERGDVLLFEHGRQDRQRVGRIEQDLPLATNEAKAKLVRAHFAVTAITTMTTIQLTQMMAMSFCVPLIVRRPGTR